MRKVWLVVAIALTSTSCVVPQWGHYYLPAAQGGEVGPFGGKGSQARDDIRFKREGAELYTSVREDSAHQISLWISFRSDQPLPIRVEWESLKIALADGAESSGMASEDFGILRQFDEQGAAVQGGTQARIELGRELESDIFWSMSRAFRISVAAPPEMLTVELPQMIIAGHVYPPTLVRFTRTRGAWIMGLN